MMFNKRLRAIINEINTDSLADVGCDHGKVSVAALIENRAKKVIACDISKKSLQKAEILAKENNLSNIEFRCGDGIKVIKENEIETLLIAGMGGYEIIKILSDGFKGINNFILCAHNNVSKLRVFLVNNGLKIVKDYVVESEGHFYNIILANKGNQILSQKQILLGQNSFDNKDYKSYLLYLKEKNDKILARDIGEERKKEVLHDLSFIEKELDESK